MTHQKVQPEFTVGDSVTWKSQAGGSTTVKKGTVLAIVPSKTDAGGLIRTYEEAGTHRSTYGGGIYRGHVSYLVEVPAKSNRGKPIIYWPAATVLRPT